MQNKLRDVIRHITFDIADLPSGIYSVEGFIGEVPVKNYLSYYAPAAPHAVSGNRFVTTTNMIVGAYVVANASPDDGLCRNVTVTRTVNGDADTPGTVTVTGTDYNSKVISEVIIPGATGVVVAGKLVFKTITDVVGAGWVIDPGTTTNDTIVVGYGALVGMNNPMQDGDILMVVWNQQILTNNTTPALANYITASLPAITYNSEVSGCSVALPEAGNSTKKLIVVFLKFKG